MAIFFLQMFLMVSYFESNSLVSPVFQISQTWDPIGHCCCTFYVYVAGASPLELVERVELCLPFDVVVFLVWPTTCNSPFSFSATEPSKGFSGNGAAKWRQPEVLSSTSWLLACSFWRDGNNKLDQKGREESWLTSDHNDRHILTLYFQAVGDEGKSFRVNGQNLPSSGQPRDRTLCIVYISQASFRL